MLLVGLLMLSAVALPPATSEVKVLRGRIVSVEAAERGGWIVLRDLGGKVLRRVQAGAGAEGIRAAEIKDYTLDAERTLVVSLGLAYPLGKSARVVAFYPEKGASRMIGMEDVVCLRLAADEGTGVWCLGPGLEDTLLHRVSGPAAGPWSLLSRKKVRLLANDGGETRQAYESGQMGTPSMTAAGPGRLLVWLPNTLAAHVVDCRSGETRTMEVAAEPNGRSNLSFGAVGEAVYGLLPLMGLEESEQLTTRYGLFRWSGGWTRVAEQRDWPRGASLAGVDGSAAWVWNRTEGRLEPVEVR